MERIARGTRRPTRGRAHRKRVGQPVDRAAGLEREPALAAREAREALARLGVQPGGSRRPPQPLKARLAVAERADTFDGGPLRMMDAVLRDRTGPQRSYTSSTSAIAIRSPVRSGLCWTTWPLTRVPFRERRSEICTSRPRATISAW
jgi:hypothetical protein